MTRKKRDAWVILRLDGEAADCKDLIAVTGDYDNPELASEAIKKSSNPSKPGSHYEVIRTRHFINIDSGPDDSSFDTKRIQGFETQHWLNMYHSEHILPAIDTVRNMWFKLPTNVRRRTLHPLLAYLTERAIANSFKVPIQEDPRAQWDFELPGGGRVEVKTILLDAFSHRSPSVQINQDAQLRFLAIVIFRPDLTVETAKMIPAEAFNVYARPGPKSAAGNWLNLRVTPNLLHFPGARDIPLGAPFNQIQE